jgi:transcription-repair coupling factor (superfamily II helicase)
MTERDLTGSKASAKDGARMPSKRKQAVDPLELRAGDFVVHEQHGIGRYVEMVQRTINGVTREYLVIEYAPAKRGQPGDRIFVPTDTLEQVSKYVGGEAPAVHRIGSGEWQKAKGRARKAVKQIAGELIRCRYSLAARTRRCLLLHRNPGSTFDYRRSKARYGKALSNGSHYLRRCWIWKNRDRNTRSI